MTNTRVNEIDLLRFLAALAVVFFHYAFRGTHGAHPLTAMAYPWLVPVAKYGYLGVELFFMISGFVILMTAASGSLRSFTISRIVRLYPAFWACCTVSFLLILALGAPHFSATIPQYLVNMTMLNGFVGVPSIDGAYWSLFVELRFYALVAVVLVLRRIHQAQLFLGLWLLASIALVLVPVGKLGFLLITDYSAFFIAGATCFLIWSKGLDLPKLCIVLGSWLLALYQALAGLNKAESDYDTAMNPYIVAALVTLFFVVMMLVALRRTGVIGRKRWLLAGVLTYPLYLLHQYIGFMVFNRAYPAVNAHLLFWGMILCVIALAYAVHVGVEKRTAAPMKRALNKLADQLERLAGRFKARSPAPAPESAS